VKWLNRGFAKSETLYNDHNAKWGRGPIILCEGPGEVFRFYEAGFRRAMATLGGALLGGQYFSFLFMHYLENVYIAADRDEAGLRFAEETKGKIRGVCLRELEVILPPAGRKDFGEATAEEIQALGLVEGYTPKPWPRRRS
jgi:DNA primase